MPVGIGAAMLVGAGVSALSAKLQSNAAKNAAKDQQTATDKALAVQQQANAPYMQVGQQALQRLSGPALAQPYTQQFTGKAGGSNGYQAPPPPPQSIAQLGQGPAPMGFMPQPGQMSQGPMASHLPSGPPMQGGAPPGPPPQGPMPGPMQPLPQGPPPQGPPMQGPPQGAPMPGGMVTLMAPTGQQKQVPRAMAQHYLAHDPSLRMIG